MSPQRETPASLRRQAEGTTGVGFAEPSLPGWAQKRRSARLVRFRGEYLTPEALAGLCAREGDAFRAEIDAAAQQKQGEGRTGDCGPHPANLPAGIRVDPLTGEVLPCRSLETTQPNGIGSLPFHGNHPRGSAAPAGTGKGSGGLQPVGLTGPHRKVAAALSWNVAHVCQKFGIDRVGFLTLTFADHVLDAREASRRFNSLATHVLAQRYAAYVRVLERQKSGRIHYHLLVVLPDDIRTGADFDAFANRDYKSANNHLRREWAFWRKTAGMYGFGRTELMPIRSDANALGQYVGKYIGKHIGQREERDKGVRLVSYSKDARMATSKFANVDKYSNEWRAKVQTFARIVQGWKPHARIRSMDDLAFALGDKRWSYTWRNFILDLPPADLSIPF